MPVLSDFLWRLRYTPEDGDLVVGLYVPLLSCAERYDRLTGYFSATAFALAARGIEGLALNNGAMRLIVGCTLGPEEVAAIEKGEALRTVVGRRLTALPLNPGDAGAQQGLEILAWLVEQGRLEVKVAVPCDEKRKPLVGTAIFHEKAGIVEDKTGLKVAFNGSLNETAAGWTQNFESLNVFTSWADPARVAAEEEHFAKLWADKAKRAFVLDVPQAVRDDLLRFLPDPGELPAALKAAQVKAKAPTPEPLPMATPQPCEPEVPVDRRRKVWAAIARAPLQAVGGERVAEATSTVTPWPHQVRAFERMYRNWPPKLLIADEVGLGKSLQAGLVMRQAMLAGRAKRILLMAPKAVVRQWQIELREKLNLNWPIYDGSKLCWCQSPAMANGHERVVSRAEWHKEPYLLVSSHLLRRADRQREVLEAADPWDFVVLDEAHHARRRGAGSTQEGGPNALLRLMRGLKARTQGLVLLTATPMQVHPVEVWDLLDLLGLPQEWSEAAFLRFFEDAAAPVIPGNDVMERMAALFRASERVFGEVEPAALRSLGFASPLRARKVLAALRDPASVPRRQMEADQRRAAVKLMQRNSPVARLVSRHTRDLLRRYHKEGKLSTRIAERDVRDEFIDLSEAERTIYGEVEAYISSTYNAVAARGATSQERNAVGFVMTIYRRRLSSSFHALRCTLEAHMASITDPAKAGMLLAPTMIEGVDDDEADAPEEDEVERLTKQALALEEQSDIERLLAMIRQLPLDTKAGKLRAEIDGLRAEGFGQVMVFTQFTDTMFMLREALSADGKARIMCFSGRGGEVQARDGTWKLVSRDEVKRRFKVGDADILLCTDAAAEGLNFQFCGALINYDCPWNPMRIEQRIGRIDRLGQRFERISIVNLHYANTVEADVYVALRHRIGLFERVVGGLQPILARMPDLVRDQVLAGNHHNIVEDVERLVEAAQAGGGGFNIDEAVEANLEEPPRPAASLTLDDLDRVITDRALMPLGSEVRWFDGRSYGLSLPGRAELRVTTDAAFYNENADAVELWSPGNPLFPDASELAAGEAGGSIQQALNGQRVAT